MWRVIFLSLRKDMIDYRSRGQDNMVFRSKGFVGEVRIKFHETKYGICNGLINNCFEYI